MDAQTKPIEEEAIDYQWLPAAWEVDVETWDGEDDWQLCLAFESKDWSPIWKLPEHFHKCHAAFQTRMTADEAETLGNLLLIAADKLRARREMRASCPGSYRSGEMKSGDDSFLIEV